MFDKSTYLILLLPLVWVLVIVVRYLMGGRFKSKDSLAKDEALATSRWQLEVQNAQQRVEDSRKSLKDQDESDKHAERNEQVYPVRESKMEHIKKEFHVGEEKETHYPERGKPKK